jgi:3-phenylpropionate/cinnamic acid dioxygenase small subunit
MNDHEAVYQLYTRYAAGMDNRQFELTRETFATGASFSLNIKGTEAVAPIEGKQAVGDFIETTTREQTDQRRHVITNIRIAQEGGGDVAYAYLSLFVTDDSGLTVQCTGQYRSEIVEEDGEPRFGRMHLDLDGAF